MTVITFFKICSDDRGMIVKPYTQGLTIIPLSCEVNLALWNSFIKTDDDVEKNKSNIFLYTVEILEERLKWLRHELKELPSTVQTKINNIINIIKTNSNLYTGILTHHDLG